MRRQRIRITSGYLRNVYEVDRLTNIVEGLSKEIDRVIKRRKLRVDAIAFTGTSGAAVAYPLSIKMKIPLVCIRKSDDNSHYYSLYEGATGIRNYIIVDDCIETGNTIKRIKTEVAKRCKTAKPVAIFLYNSYYYSKQCKGIRVYADRY